MACVMLGACSPARVGGSEVDVNAAALAAQADIDRYAAAGKRNPAREAAASRPAAKVDPGSTDAARTVVQRYYAFIAAHRTDEAWRLWGHGGADCGRSAQAFADALRPVAVVDAMVGPPGDADAGAGQRYVTVSAVLRAAPTGGAPIAAKRTVTLHRVADGIDSTDPAAHLWRIASEAGGEAQVPLPCTRAS